jgi:hypothetical protein
MWNNTYGHVINRIKIGTAMVQTREKAQNASSDPLSIMQMTISRIR